jgi:hypothetical protein
MKRTREDLEEADRISEQQVVKPTPDEKAAISSFCSLSLQCKTIEEKIKTQVKDIKPEIKTLRKSILEDVKKKEYEIVQVPQEMRKHIEGCPPYIRLVKNNKDLTITPEVISEALQSITDEDIQEYTGNPPDILVEAILSAVRRIVRSFSEQIKLTDSVPRGIKPADVPFADAALSKQAVQLFTHSSKVTASESEKRTAVSSAKTAMSERQTTLDAFFERSGITHQRVTLENKQYNLCRRLTVSKPKVTFKILEDVLKNLDVIKTLKSKTDILDAIKNRRADIQKLLAARISTLPNSSKSVIHLQRVKS